MLAAEKRRCELRGKRIAWCRKLGKFCDAPREYYTCPDYESTQSGIVEKVQHNIDALRHQVFRVEMQGSITEFRRGSWVQIPPPEPEDLKSRFGNELRSMILEGEREGREVGAMICFSPSGELHLSRTCWGVKGRVEVVDCHDHLRPYGSYHIHLHGSEVFSPQDLEQAIEREQLSCIGYLKAGAPTLKCIAPRKYYEYPIETKTSIRTALKEAAQDIAQLSRGSPEARKLSREVQKKLHDIEQFLSASEIQL